MVRPIRGDEPVRAPRNDQQVSSGGGSGPNGGLTTEEWRKEFAELRLKRERQAERREDRREVRLEQIQNEIEIIERNAQDPGGA